MQDDVNNNEVKPTSGDGCHDDMQLTTDESVFHAFTRVSTRKSLTSNAAMVLWLEAQERLVQRDLDVSLYAVTCLRDVSPIFDTDDWRILPLTFCFPL